VRDEIDTLAKRMFISFAGWSWATATDPGEQAQADR
jgi:hypothetical protein